MTSPKSTTRSTTNKAPERTEVALFPIPDVVAFPGMELPLHVFEPRYRQLVRDCIRDHRMLAVSHVLKTIHQPKKHHEPAEVLSSNQATYKPRAVFSAGHCEILEEADDGRLLVTVAMTERLALIEEVQSLPYRIVHCAPISDETKSDEQDQGARKEERDLQLSVHHRLIELVRSQNPDLVRDLEKDEWTELDPSQYSLSIFRCLRLDPDIMQAILESRSAGARLEMIWSHLRQT